MMGAFNAARRRRFGGGGGGFNFGGIGRPFVSADGTPKIGQKLFSDSFTLKSDIGNPILRQTPILTDGTAAQPVTWVEKGVLKNIYYDPATARRDKVAPSPATPNMSLVARGHEPVDRRHDQVDASAGCSSPSSGTSGRSTRSRCCNTGMTRDGLFLIENGEIAGPVQNFRWNMSPLVGFNEHLGDRQAGADSHRRSLRRPAARRWCRRSGSKTFT